MNQPLKRSHGPQPHSDQSVPGQVHPLRLQREERGDHRRKVKKMCTTLGINSLELPFYICEMYVGMPL